MTPAIYIAGTGQHSGKTVFSVGFVAALAARGLKVGYMKPVGQRTVQVGEERVDEDVVLMAHLLQSSRRLSAINPVTLPSSFIQQFLEEGRTEELLIRLIQEGFEEVSQGRDLVVVEGTGNAGVGSVVGLSNARVARLLGAQALVITGGGVGRPIDEFALNRALLAREGVPVIGAVANKFQRGRIEKFAPLLRQWYSREGVPLLGIIPYEPMLTEISLRQIVQEIGAEVINGEDRLDMRIREFIIGAAPPHRLIPLLQPGVLAIVPGDRDDLVLAAVSSEEVAEAEHRGVAVLLTSGILPAEQVLRLARKSRVPVIASEGGTFELARQMSDVVAKMAPGDDEKVAIARRLVAELVDLAAAVAPAGVNWPAG